MRCRKDFFHFDWLVACAKLLMFLTLNVRFGAGQTSFGSYSSSCPRAETIVAAAVRSASAVDASVPPKLLRLLFHDCFVEGCDASVLLDSTGTAPAERSDPSNSNLVGLGVINGLKSTLEIACPGVVSCADILVLGAREAVVVVGGPRVEVPTGRLDGFESLASNVRPNLPDTPFSLDQLLSYFGKKGMSLKDLVTLSGAHTIGVSHCSACSDRFSFGSNGTGTAIDSTMDPSYAAQLLQKCPATPSPSTLIVNDLKTPTVFDNAFYSNIELGRGLFHSDAVLFADPRSRSFVQQFAQDQNSFFSSWAESFLKLSLVGVKTGSQGEVRKQCNVRNS